MAIQIGSVVWLKSGAQTMSVTLIESDIATCVWGNGGREHYPVACLTEEDPIPQLEETRWRAGEGLRTTRPSSLGGTNPSSL